MQWFYANAGAQAGPIDEAELDRLVGQGLVRGDTLVWREGMPAWQPLGVVRGWPNTPPLSGSPAYTPPASPGLAMGSAPLAAAGAVHYAGFWIRFVARLIDGVLLGVAGAIIRVPLFLMFGVSRGFGRGFGGGFGRDASGFVFLPAIMGILGISVLLSLALAAAYEVYFVSTRGGTLGKLALGLKIVRADGSPVDAGLALGRWFAHFLSGAIFMIGYIMAGFDEQKRALHDHICQTRVIYSR
jgi:uncharacterized RDD family membrane protein YckC